MDITNIKLHKGKGEDKAKKVMSLYENLRDDYSPFFQQVERIEKLTLLDEDETNSSNTRSKIYDPVLYGQVMDYVARYTSDDPKGTFVPSEYGDMFKAKILNANFAYDWRKDKMKTKIKKLIKMSKVLGMAYARNTYKIEKRKKDIRAVKANGGLKRVKGEYTVFDGPSCEVLSFYNVFPQYDAQDWDSMEYVYVRDWTSVDELKRIKDKGGEYQNLSKVEKLIGSLKNEDNRKSPDRGDNPETLKRLMQLDDKTDKFMMVTKYTKERWVSVVGNILVRDIPNPYAHGEFPVIPLYNDVWYDNVISPSSSFFVERLQRAINKLINMRFDNVEGIMSPLLRVSEDVDPTILRMGQFKVINAEAGDVDWFSMPDAMGNTFVQSLGVLKDGVKTATAEQDFSTQAKNVNPVNKFATGLRQQGDRNVRRGVYHGGFIDDFICRLAGQWLSLTRQFAPTKKIVRIAGRDLVDYFKDNMYIDTDELTGPISVDEAIKGGQGELLKGLGLAYEHRPGEYKKKFRFSSDGLFGWIRLSVEDFAGDYDYIPETESTVLADKAEDRTLKLTFFKVLMDVIELVKAGFLTEKAIYDLAEQFGFRNSESMFNFTNIDQVISSQQSGFTGMAGGAGGIGKVGGNVGVEKVGERRGFPANPSNIEGQTGNTINLGGQM